jgi:CBS domain containing-hemolysin-like protein
MNKYEKRAQSERKAAMRSSTAVWSAGIALVVVVFLILGLSASAPQSFFSKAAVGIAILLLIVRQVSRRLRGGAPRAAQPDPKSTIKLD